MKAKLFYVTPEALIMMMNGKAFRVIQNPLPTDAKIVDSGYDYPRRTVVFVVQSETYDDIPEGARFPDAAMPRIKSLEEL
jgi:hypothetical protein